MNSEHELDRHSTNFSTKITQVLKKKLDASKCKDVLAFYQILPAEFFKMNVAKGLVLWHHMGFGKTVEFQHISFELLKNNPDWVTVVISPKALIPNLVKSEQDYENITGNKVYSDRTHYVRSSVATEKYIAQIHPDRHADIDSRLSDNRLNLIIDRIKNLKKYFIVIEESHLFARKVANGSESAIRLYDLIMATIECRIIMLSGSLIASSPFELAIIMNLLSGEEIFPIDPEVFESTFIDHKTSSIKSGINRAIFQNRIHGLVSRMKPEYLSAQDLTAFPRAGEPKNTRVIMEGMQLSQYLLIREREITIEEDLKKRGKGKISNGSRFRNKGKSSSTFMVRSRQASNATVFPAIIRLFGKKDRTDEEMKKAIFTCDVEYRSSCKFVEIARALGNEYKNQKGVIASQFVGFGGADSLSVFLLTYGAQEVFAPDHKKDYPDVDAVSDSDNPYPWLKNVKFALINGRIDQEKQGQLVDYFKEKDNLHGEKLTILIVGYEQCMGLDLTEGRFSIFLEVPFTNFYDQQLQYRINRRGSHKRLPVEEQTVQHHRMIAIYPDDFDPTTKVEFTDIDDDFVPREFGEALVIPTDEIMYDNMIRNYRLNESFLQCVEEVSIECELIKILNPEKDHVCKSCAPNNSILYTQSGIKTGPIQAIREDMRIGDTCKDVKKKTIKADKITVLVKGEKLDYYYIKVNTNLSGYRVYFESTPKQFDEVYHGSPIYEIVVDAIEVQKK